MYLSLDQESDVFDNCLLMVKTADSALPVTFPEQDENRRVRRSFSRPKAWAAAAICAAGLASGTPAMADTLNVTSVAVPLYDSGINMSYGSTTWTGVIAGQIVVYATDSAMPTAPAFNVYAWCVDLYHDISIGTNNYAFTIGGPVTTDGNGLAVSAATSNKLMTLAAYGNALIAGGGGSDVSTAIQLAIWQTEYTGLTFSTTNTAVTSNVAAYENYADSHTLAASVLSPTSGQQRLITNSVSPVPEPVSVVLLATGLIGTAVVRRRRR